MWDYDVGQIIHLAAFPGEEVQRGPYTGVRLNLMGPVNVLEAVRLEACRGLPSPTPAPSIWARSRRGSRASTRGLSDYLCKPRSRVFGLSWLS